MLILNSILFAEYSFSFQLSLRFLFNTSKPGFLISLLSHLIAYRSYTQISSYSPSHLNSVSFIWFSPLYLILQCTRVHNSIGQDRQLGSFEFMFHCTRVGDGMCERTRDYQFLKTFTTRRYSEHQLAINSSKELDVLIRTVEHNYICV